MKYFKLDKDKREIIIDKYKKYNVNVDILNLIIDLKCENDRLNNIINESEKYIHNELILDFYNDDMPCELIINKMEKMIKELKGNNKNE